MANLSNINNKFIVTDGGNVLIGQTSAVGSSIFQVTGASTFAGNVILSSALPLLYLTNTTASTGKNWRLSSATNGKFFIAQEGVVDALTIDHTSGNSTFAGTVEGTTARFDTLNNKANSANIIYRSGTNTIVGNNADALVVQDGGKVGIGVATPGNKLTVDVGNGDFYSDTSKGITAYDLTGGVYTAMGRRGIYTAGSHQEFRSASSYMSFYTGTDGNPANATEKMRVTSGGNINLGTGSLGQVAYQLRVDSDFDNGLYMSAGSSSSNYAMYIESGAGSILFNVRGDGNVGIGTTLPLTKLHVEGASGSIYVQSTLANQNASVFFNSKVGTTQSLKWEIGTNIGNGADFEIYDRVLGGTRFLIETGTGNTGIGTTTPYSRLDVTGVLSIGAANADPSFTVASTGMSLINGGSLDIVQGFAGTSSAGDTLVFKYEATSWKAWQLEYCISAAYGFAKGGVGGYLNGGTPQAYYYTTTNQGSNMNISSVVATNGGANNQHVIITITGIFGIHTCVRMKYTQSGGDGAPRADRASLTFNS